MSPEIASLVIILGYLFLLVGVTVYSRNKNKNASKSTEGFFMANRGINQFLLPLTMIAATQSTFAFLGGPGMYYQHGVSYLVIVMSQVWVALMIIVFGNKIRKQAKDRGYQSIGDYFQDRFHSKYIKALAAIISVIMTLVFLAMQYVGNARAMQVITGNVIPYEFALIIGVAFSLFYVMVGGAGGVALLDGIQAVILLAGMILAAIVVLQPVGGVDQLFLKVQEQDASLLSRPGAKGLYTDAYWIMQFIVLPFGIWLCPHIWTKQLMAKDENAIAKSGISIPVSQVILFGFSGLFVGLAGHIIAGDFGAADNVLPTLIKQYSNWVVAAVIMAAAIAAGMSTINSMLLATSQYLSQDVILINRKDKISQEQNMKIARIVIVILAIVGALIALRPPQSLVQVVQDVAYTGLAQLAPALILGMYWKKAKKEGVMVGMTVGIVMLFAMRILNISPLGIPGFMWAFFSNLLLIVIISLVKTNSKTEQEAIEQRFFAE